MVQGMHGSLHTCLARLLQQTTIYSTQLALQGHITIEPHNQDVAPFTALNASTSGLLDDTIQMAVFRYQVRRSFWSGNLNTVYPVLAVAVLSVIVFWIPEDELATRIELCAALLLTLIGK